MQKTGKGGGMFEALWTMCEDFPQSFSELIDEDTVRRTRPETLGISGKFNAHSNLAQKCQAIRKAI